MNQKGFANIILVVVIVVLLGAVGYFAFVKKSEPVAQQPTPTPTQTIAITETPVSPTPTPTPTPPASTIVNSKGVLIIYDPEAPFSELKGKGFKSLTWYLIPENVKFPGTPSTDTELKFDSNSKCIKPADQYSDYAEKQCLSTSTLGFKWGYGDRVSISGSKQSSGVVLVKEMQVLSFQ